LLLLQAVGAARLPAVEQPRDRFARLDLEAEVVDGLARARLTRGEREVDRHERRQELRVACFDLDRLGPEEALVERAARLEVRDMQMDVNVAHCGPAAVRAPPQPSWAINVSMRPRTSSRIRRTTSTVLPFGSSSGQSSRRRPGTTGHFSPQPIVTSSSEPAASSRVRSV